MMKIFAFLGPGVGVILSVIHLYFPVWSHLSMDQKEHYIGFIFPMILLSGYIVGIVPALFAGFAYRYIFDLEIKTKNLKFILPAVAAAFTGFLITTVMSFIFFGSGLGRLGLIPILSALVCSGIFYNTHRN